MTHPLPLLVSRLCQRTVGLVLLLWLLALGAPAWADLTVNGNATVTDSTTSLVWDQCPYGLSGAACATGTAFDGTWAGALDAAVAANVASYKGFTDWRVPNKNELESITKIDIYTSGQPTIDTSAFPGTPLTWFWTSTTYAPEPSKAWIVLFNSGGTYVNYKTDTNYVRLVRSGQSFASFDALAQTISFANPGAQTFDSTPTLTATASSGLTPSFTSSTTGVCTITSGGVLTFVTVGTCTIAANQVGNANFYAAPQLSQSFAVNQASQTISFANPGTQTMGTAPTLSATASSNLTPTFTSATTGVCTITSGGALSFVTAGTCTIAANQVGNAYFNAAPQVSQSFAVAQASQVITFANPGAQTFGSTPPTLTATASSGLTPSFASSTTGVCTITSGGALSFVTAGTCTINADQGGNANFYAAPQVSQSFAVGQASQVITFANPGAQTFGATPTLTATASSGLTPSFTSATTGICTITSGGALGFVTAGTCTINADQTGNGNYSAAPQVSQSFAVGQASQTITFANPGAQTFGSTPTLTATASSGLTPSFTSSTTGVCTITSGGALGFVAAGTCTINADQAGNGSYSAAPQVSQSFAVGQANQAITFGAAPSVIVGGTGTVSTTGGASGIARVYASTTPAACSVNVSTGVVTGVAAGSNNCTITANQAGNANYSAAGQASQTISIGAATPPIPTPTPTPTPTIPLLGASIGGMAGLPQIVNMAAGDGPAFMVDLVAILSSALGQPLHFIAQNTQGSVRLGGFNGGNLAFVPHSFQTGDTRANGVYPLGNGQYTVVANGQSLTIAPTLVQLDQLTALLPGLSASQGDNGVVAATFNGETYVVQAGAGVQLDPASGSARLVMGSDGYFHFIDALGNNQILYPAFAEPATLRSILLGMDPGATQSVQLDGTATIVFNGLRYTLVPDLTLSNTPADRVGQHWWQESATRYWVVNVQAPGTVQGVTVRP